jgi:MSHA biogenesis protein MshK
VFNKTMFNKAVFTLIACAYTCVAHAQHNAPANTDPTRPLGYTQTAGIVGSAGQESIVLNSILISSDRKIAIISGQQLRENETLKGVGAKLTKIDAEAVTLQQGNKTWRVLLNKTTIRK